MNNNNGSTEFLNFSDALHYLRWGEAIARRRWRDGVKVTADYSDRPTKIHIANMSMGRSRRLDGQDIMAEDWYVV